MANAKRVLKYTFKGASRTGVVAVGLPLSLLSLQIFFVERMQLQLFMARNPEADPIDIYNNIGFLSKKLFNYNGELQEDAIEAYKNSEKAEEFREGMNSYTESNITILAPFFALMAFKMLRNTLPKGLSYLRAAYHEVKGDEKRVLTKKDFEKFRDLNFVPEAQDTIETFELDN